MSPWDVSRFVAVKSCTYEVSFILTNSKLIVILSGVLVDLQDQVREKKEVKANCMIFCCSLDCSCSFHLNNLLNCSLSTIITLVIRFLLIYFLTQTCWKQIWELRPAETVTAENRRKVLSCKSTLRRISWNGPGETRPYT